MCEYKSIPVSGLSLMSGLGDDLQIGSVVVSGAGTMDPAQIPTMATTPFYMMTDAQLEEERNRLNTEFQRFYRHVPEDNQRWQALVDRRRLVSGEIQSRVNRRAVFSVMAVSVPVCSIAGAGVAWGLGRSKLNGGVFGGLIGAAVPFVYPYVFTAFMMAVGARNF